MLVRELIEQLAEMPAEMPVKVELADGGLIEISSVVRGGRAVGPIALVVLDIDDWQGHMDDYLEHLADRDA